jgi:hypothetical protein
MRRSAAVSGDQPRQQAAAQRKARSESSGAHHERGRRHEVERAVAQNGRTHRPRGPPRCGGSRTAPARLLARHELDQLCLRAGRGRLIPAPGVASASSAASSSAVPRGESSPACSASRREPPAPERLRYQPQRRERNRPAQIDGRVNCRPDSRAIFGRRHQAAHRPAMLQLTRPRAGPRGRRRSRTGVDEVGHGGRGYSSRARACIFATGGRRDLLRWFVVLGSLAGSASAGAHDRARDEVAIAAARRPRPRPAR